MAGVSLVMIVRDEEANLPACLTSCADLVDELVIVDTGSVDRTKEIAASFGAKVFDLAWCDDFAAARNESLRHATGDVIVWMDADDRIDRENGWRLAELLERVDPAAAYQMDVVSRDVVGQTPVSVQVRLFPRGRLRWRGRVHEEGLLDADVPLMRSEVVIRHEGYLDQDVMRRKTERNLRLLYLKLAEMPGDARTLLQIGGDLLNLGLPAEAYPVLCRAADSVTETVTWYPLAVYGRALAAHRLGVGDADAVRWLIERRTEESRTLLARLKAHGVWC